jgi:phosphoglycolate phosphatase
MANSFSPTVTSLPTHQSVLFCDFDGPIVDVCDRYYRTYELGLSTISAMHQRQSGETLTLSPLTQDQFWWMKQNKVADIEIATRSGLPEALVAPFLAQVARLVNHPHLLKLDKLQPETGEALRQVKRQGFRLVVVTLRHPRQVHSFLQAHDLCDVVDEVFGAADNRAAYSNHVEHKVSLLTDAIATQIAKGFATENAWMIGDTEADILAGQTLGLRTIAVTCGIRSAAFLQDLHPSEITPNLPSALKTVFFRQALQVA